MAASDKAPDAPIGSVTTLPHVLSCDLPGGAALLDLQSSKYFSLNEVGAKIWEMLQAGASLPDIHSKLVALYDVDPEQCRRDIDAVMRQLADAGIVKLSDQTNWQAGTAEQH